MSDSPGTTPSESSGEVDPNDDLEQIEPLDLGAWPYLMIIPSHLGDDEPEKLAEIKQKLRNLNANLVDDMRIAQIILTFTSKTLRARHDMRNVTLKENPRYEIELDDSNGKASHSKSTEATKRGRSPEPSETSRVRKARKGTAKDDESCSFESASHQEVVQELARFSGGHWVTVVHISWLEDSLKLQKVQSLEKYIVKEGTRVVKPFVDEYAVKTTANPPKKSSDHSDDSNISSQALKSDRLVTPPDTFPEPERPKPAIPDTSEFADPGDDTQSPNFQKSSIPEPPSHREESNDSGDDMYEKKPDWVKRGLKYSCQRPTLAKSKNEGFLEQLRLIRLSREIRATKKNPSKPGHDDAGNRDINDYGADAYANMIASVAAYPYKLKRKEQIAMLPRCSGKAVLLFEQFKKDGYLHEARQFEESKELQIRYLFWNIHGVGAATALKYFDDGCETLGHVRQREFCSMTDAQKIGLEFYGDFQRKILREESEQIASVIIEHTKRVCGDEQAKHMIVGGYRRGKAESGDVDVVVSHPSPNRTEDLVHYLTRALMKSGWVTHILGINDSHSRHNEQAIPTSIRESHKGFDTLDKALLVWQDPSWPTRKEDLAKDPKAKNPAVHRRVDIIISPWKTVGCALAGWTAGKTFQKDIRKYSRAVKDWKFDSTGVEDLKTKKLLDLEKYDDEKTRAKTLVEAEKRVFKALDLPYLAPEQRCTD